MRRICCLAVCTVFLVAAPVFCLHPASADSPDTKAVHERGIAVLASSIGTEFSPEDLAEFVRQGKFSPVVVDWAWITYHWGKTDFAAVNRFLQLMAFRNVPVAAMYRPRFLWNPTVPTQAAQDGKRAVDHAEICYSIASARRWGISWGEKILDQCPSFREIIIYNPLNRCHCPKCSAARAKGPHSAVMGFLAEAKSAWRAKQPGVKLGVVHMPIPEFWKADLDVVDVAHPFLCVREDVDPAKEVANINAVRPIVNEKMGSCLAKITWGEGEKVSTQKLKTIDDLARKESLPYFVWTFHDLFLSDLYDPKQVLQAFGLDYDQIGPALKRLSGRERISESAEASETSVKLSAKAPLRECLEGKHVSIVAVKDFIVLENSGAAVANIEFQRYFPVVDSEQIVLGRWVSARDAAGHSIPVSIAKVLPDSEGNLIHTYKLEKFPEKQNVCVTVTSLVARREKPAPAGKFPIPDPDQCPTEVRRYLSKSPVASIDHPEIKKQADELLGRTNDAYELAGELAAIMKAKSYTPAKPSPNDPPDPEATVASRTLRYGASCCASAVCCTSVLRACGIPTQLTYSPAGYLHGIVRFYLKGYGWVRMDGTCGAGKLPMVQEEDDLGMVRLFDMPLEMEKGEAAWAWPFLYCDGSCRNPVRVPDGAAATVSMSSKGGAWCDEPPPPHYEPGSWNRVIGSAPFQDVWENWDALVTVSRQAVASRRLGEFTSVTGRITALRGLAELAGSYVTPVQLAQSVAQPEVELTAVDDTKGRWAEKLLEEVQNAQHGAAQFAAIDALAKKAKESDAVDRSAILSVAIATMKDKSRPVHHRWPCCYVISRSGDKRGVPDLIEVLLHDEVEIMRAVAAEALGGISKNREARDALLKAANRETSQTVRDVLARYLGREMPTREPSSAPAATPAQKTGPAGESRYTPEQIRSISVETFLERMQNPEPGYHRFAALWALGQKAKESDAATRKSILATVVAAMNDKRRTEYQRFQCCYVLSESGDEQAVPDLVKVLLHDESEVMRSVAAEALAQFRKSSEAREALLKAAREETSEQVREVLGRHLGQEALAPASSPAPTAAGGVEELAPSGPPQPAPGPARPVAKPLPWPFPGDCKAQNILNNYQTATDDYIHLALDFMHPAGTPVRAVGPGYVAAIWSQPPHLNDFFIVAPNKGVNRGWAYLHMDPKTFTFKDGDDIRQGQELGKLVEFSIDGKRGDHLHLAYVTFSNDPSGRVNAHSLLDPLYFFDWKDTEAPLFLPLRFVLEGTTQQFRPDAEGVVTVSGKVDILAAITDSAYPGQRALLGVPVVMLSISDGRNTMQKLVLDHRGDVGDWKQTKPLYVSRNETKRLFNTGSRYYQTLRVTKTDGDGKITSRDANQCWDTTARDRSGDPVWPDGRYSVNVYAWDIAGNRAVAGAMVQVKNTSGG